MASQPGLLPSLRETTRAHRRALRRRLPDALVLLTAGPERPRNGDVLHAYRQSSDFLWLTGVEQPGCALLLDSRRGEETLFVPRLTQQHAVWMGPLPSRREAREAYGIRRVRYATELASELRRRGGRLVHADPRGASLVRRHTRGLRAESRELREALDELRVLKDEGEVRLLEKASAATAAGHLAAMSVARPGMFEYQVQAEIERAFRHEGCAQLGYGSIVAAGRNSAILHYVRNDQRLSRGDLLLVDAGGEFRGYTADVTRTFPVSGRFGARQRDVYEIVLAAQERCIDYARAGHVTMDLQRLSERVLAEGLRALGLLRGGMDELLETEAVRVFYPHGIGHALGLDVHDVQGGRRRRLRLRPGSGKLRFRARLEPGFVITVEPGIYFMPALLRDPAVRRKHRGRIDFAKAEGWTALGGVRIEDDVVVRPEGPPRNLTRVPKTVRDVEAACAR